MEPPPLVKINYPEIQRINFPEIFKESNSDSDGDVQLNDDSENEFIDEQNETQNLIEMKKDPKRKKTESIKAKSPCDTCGKSYNSTEMRYHLNKHLGLFPYVCTVKDCDKSFTSPNLLRNHRSIHSEDRKFKCDECGATFKRLGSLNHHKSYHGEPKIPCTVCNSMIRNQ